MFYASLINQNFFNPPEQRIQQALEDIRQQNQVLVMDDFDREMKQYLISLKSLTVEH